MSPFKPYYTPYGTIELYNTTLFKRVIKMNDNLAKGSTLISKIVSETLVELNAVMESALEDACKRFSFSPEDLAESVELQAWRTEEGFGCVVKVKILTFKAIYSAGGKPTTNITITPHLAKEREYGT